MGFKIEVRGDTVFCNGQRVAELVGGPETLAMAMFRDSLEGRELDPDPYMLRPLPNRVTSGYMQPVSRNKR